MEQDNAFLDVNQRQFVAFRLGKTEFAVPIEQVWRIVSLTDITRVPRVPSFIEGIINLRGEIIPVIDLRKRLGLEVGERTDESRIVVVQTEGHRVGMIVDTITEIVRLPEDTIEPPPDMIADISGVFLTGMTTYNDRLFIVLDLSRVLTMKEADELKRAESPHE